VIPEAALPSTCDEQLQRQMGESCAASNRRHP
jgi:hypothetical protein